MHSKILVPAVAGVLLTFAGAAGAVTKTANFTVTATVAKNCVISANPLNLGTFDGTNDLTATSTVAVRCTNGTPYTVNLSKGASTVFTARTLTSGTNTLSYNLYTDTTYANIFGDGSTGTSNRTGTGTGFAAATNLTVAGRLLAADNTGNADAGTYTDTIVASVVY